MTDIWSNRLADQLATGWVEVFGIRIDGISTINDQKPSMTNKKTIARKSVPACAATKLDAATLSNMARQPGVVVTSVDEVVLRRIAELLIKLSPSKLHLVDDIIRCVLVEHEKPAL